MDIDQQAVEVSKLSLLLNALEGEDSVSLSRQMKLFHDRALPNLSENIKCGNSLIGTDYLSSFLIPDPEDIKRLNAFDWTVGFPAAMKSGGFQCVIGNPPWGGDIDRHLDYFHHKFPATTQEHTDSFKLFIENGVNLLSPTGVVGMIVPNTILRQRRLKDVRAFLTTNEIISLVDLGENVFEGVVAPSCVFVARRKKPSKSHQVSVTDLAQKSDVLKEDALRHERELHSTIKQTLFEQNPDLAFTAAPKASRAPVMTIGALPDLKCKDAGINYQRVGTGMQDKGKSDLADRLLYEGNRKNARDRMYWKGSDIGRYYMADSTNRFCRPNFLDFVRANEVVRLNNTVYDTAPKILFRQTADTLIATIDDRGVWFGRSIIAIVLQPQSMYKPQYILGLLNSKYVRWLYDNLAHETGRVFAQVKLAKVKQLPILVIDFANAEERSLHDKMVHFADSMLLLTRKLVAAQSQSQKAAVQHQIESTDADIDRLVYKLYKLNEKEISAVEIKRAEQ